MPSNLRSDSGPEFLYRMPLLRWANHNWLFHFHFKGKTSSVQLTYKFAGQSHKLVRVTEQYISVPTWNQRQATKILDVLRDQVDRYVERHAQKAGWLLLGSIYLFFLLFRLLA